MTSKARRIEQETYAPVPPDQDTSVSFFPSGLCSHQELNRSKDRWYPSSVIKLPFHSHRV
jgi:hypothetical protein